MSAHERERLSAWLDGELTPAERAEVDAHLAGCAECRARLAELGAVDALAREQPLEVPAGYFESFPGRVRSRIEGGVRATPAPGPRRPGPSRWRLPGWTWAAAAAVLLGVVTPLTLVRLGRDGTPVARAPQVAAPKEARAKGEAGRAVRLEERAEGRVEDAAPPPMAAAPAPAPPPEAARGAQGTSAEAFEKAPETAPSRTRAPEPAAARTLPETEAKDVAAFAAGPLDEDEAPGKSARPAPAAPPRRQATMADAAASRAAADLEAPGAAPAMTNTSTAQAAGVREGLGRLDKEAVSEDRGAFARLAREAPADAAAWREHREAWRAFVAAHPHSPLADEARVRTIEAGIEAWRTGGDPADLTRARDDAEAYLARDDAPQADRVRRALDAAKSPR